MKKIILVIVVLSLIACKNNDFDEYLSSLNMIELPMNLDNNSKLNQPERYNQTLFKKFKQKQTNHPYGIAFKNNTSVGIIEVSTSDNMSTPVLITYDIIGNKIDSLNLLDGIVSSKNNQTSVYVQLTKDLNLTITDSIKNWKNDQKSNQITSSLNIQYHIEGNGLIKKIKESDSKFFKPTPIFELSGVYTYEYEHNTDDYKENHYIEFKDGKLFYYGTSDDFDEAREGYLPGFYSTEISNFTISENKFDFTLDITNSNFYKSPITPTLTPKNNELWDVQISKHQRKYMGRINNTMIILESPNMDTRTFKKT